MSHLDAFQDGLLAAKAGKKMIARLQFEQAVEIQPDFMHAWLWLAWTADSPDQADVCLTKAHSIAPENRLVSSFHKVIHALARYELDESDSESESESEPTTQESKLEEKPTPEQEDDSATPSATPSEKLSVGNSNDTKDFQDLQKELSSIRDKSTTQADVTAKSRLPEVTNASTATASEDPMELDEKNFFDTAEWDTETRTDTASELPNAASPSSHPSADVDGTDTQLQLDSQAQEHDEEGDIAVELGDLKKDLDATLDLDANLGADQNSEQTSRIESCSNLEKTEPETDEALPTILVVDDSPTVRKLVTMTLKSGGYNVRTAEDGVEAMKMLATLTPDLILLDVNMPRMDGYKLCKLIKRHDKTKFIPVVMLSGKDGMFDKLRGTLVGCNDYISKPFKTADLLRHLEQYVFTPAT